MLGQVLQWVLLVKTVLFKNKTMANKLLILGAAMAHKNKSYNLSRSIVPAVDNAVGTITKGLASLAKQREADRKIANNTSRAVNQYLDKLPENPELELLPEPIRDLYYNELNNTKASIGKLIGERGGPNAADYAPGTEGYIKITSEINKEKKYLDKLYKDALKFQQINANWFNEHGNISGFWKETNPELYRGMSQILNSENPNYTVTLDENKDWIISTDIDTTDYSLLGADDSPSAQPKNSKNIKVNLDDLDWAQVSMPEIIKINDTLSGSINKGLQGVALTSVDTNNLRIGYEAMIGNDEGKLYSLMFDELPIGDLQGKMSLLSDSDFTEDYPDFKENDPSTWPDFQEMKNKTIERLVKMNVSGNESSIQSSPKEIDVAFEDFAYEVGTFKNEILKLGNTATKKQIIDYIINKSPYKGEINSSSGNMLQPKSSGTTQSIMQEFDIGSIIDSYIAGGYKNPDEIISTIIRETRSTTDSKKTPRYLRQYNSLTQDQKNTYYSGGL